MLDILIPAISLVIAALVSLAVVLSQPRAKQSWLFFFGVVAFASGVALNAMIPRAANYESFLRLHNASLVARSLTTLLWLAFSMCYARGDAAIGGKRRILPLACFAILIAALTALVIFQPGRSRQAAVEAGLLHYGAANHALSIVLLIAIVVLLMNLEATFRASIGTTRWRVKFVALGLGLICGAMIYTRSQTLLFSGQPMNLAAVEASALLLGSILLGLAWLRGGFGPLQVFPSRASLAQSITVLLVGGYLFVVGVLAQFVTVLGGKVNFQAQAFLILIVIVGIGALLVSDRLRLKLQHAFSRYFGRPFYDFRKVWTLASERLSNPADADALCAAAARLVAETFNTLSVRVWLLDPGRQRLTLGASTAPTSSEAQMNEVPVTADNLRAVTPADTPINLEGAKGELADQLRQSSVAQFGHGGERLAVPLASNGRQFGLMVLADRVNGEPYTPEEANLLRCVAAQFSASLQTLRVTGELLQAKELEAFQTMSAFFVHDLKNTVSTLNLMLQNLPVHFDNPEFRKDALRGIGNTVDRVNHLIARLSALRKKVELRPLETDLAELFDRTIEELNGLPEVDLVRGYEPARAVLVDREHFGSVLSNLLLNARDAVGENRTVEVKVFTAGDSVVATVTDHGCGMTAEFIATSLFRPFNSTKNKGLGIGMFQCKVLVEAHRGRMEIESTPGSGTTARVILPALPK